MLTKVDLTDTEYAGTLSLYRNEPQSARRARGKHRGNKRDPRDYGFLATVEDGQLVRTRKQRTTHTTQAQELRRRDIILQATMGSIHTGDTDA